MNLLPPLDLLAAIAILLLVTAVFVLTAIQAVGEHKCTAKPIKLLGRTWFLVLSYIILFIGCMWAGGVVMNYAFPHVGHGHDTAWVLSVPCAETVVVSTVGYGQVRVRLTGIEVIEGAEDEARSLLTELLPRNRLVYLEFTRPRHDADGNLLVYMRLGPESNVAQLPLDRDSLTVINEVLVEHGFANHIKERVE